MIAFTTLIGQYNAALLTLADGDFGHPAIDVKSRLILDHTTSSMKIGDGTDILDVLVWDAASAGTEKGFMPLGVYKANPTNLADTDGDWVPFQFNGAGALRVDAEVSVTTGADKAEDSAHVTADIGSYVLSVREDALASSTSADGDYQSFKTDSLGALWVRSRAAYAEDAAHTTGDMGNFVLAVANEAKSDLVSADGDYTPFAVSKKGELYTITEIAENGTEADIGVDEAGDGEIDVAYHATNFIDLATIAVGAGETLTIKGFDCSSDVLVAARLVVDDDGTPTKIIRKLPVTENNGYSALEFLRGIEVAGSATISVILQARCMRPGKTAHCGGGINAYK